MSNYFITLKILLTNFRGSEYLLRSKKEFYYDHIIEDALNRINSFFLPLWVLLGGLALALYVGKKFSDSLDTLAIIMIGWFFIDLIIVTPIIYMAILPKPIKDHIKRWDEMTASEIEENENKKTASTQSSNRLENYKRKYLP